VGIRSAGPAESNRQQFTLYGGFTFATRCQLAIMHVSPSCPRFRRLAWSGRLAFLGSEPEDPYRRRTIHPLNRAYDAPFGPEKHTALSTALLTDRLQLAEDEKATRALWQSASCWSLRRRYESKRRQRPRPVWPPPACPDLLVSPLQPCHMFTSRNCGLVSSHLSALRRAVPPLLRTPATSPNPMSPRPDAPRRHEQ
jgi:hypothetical protein